MTRPLSFQIENGFEAVSAIPDYMEEPAVGNNAVLIVWHDPDLAKTCNGGQACLNGRLKPCISAPRVKRRRSAGGRHGPL